LRVFGFEPTTIWITLGFGLLLAAVVFCLGFFLLGLGAVRSVQIGAGLGVAQSLGSLYYIWRRFVRPGPPPRNGGEPG
jgi:hypothetical protein